MCGVETGDGRYLNFTPKVVGNHHTLKKGGPKGRDENESSLVSKLMSKLNNKLKAFQFSLDLLRALQQSFFVF